MKLIWTLPALADREAVFTYVADADLDAAIRLDDLFGDAAGRLRDFPESGRPGTATGTRELIPHRSYRLVYRIENGTIWILALIHAARQWPPARMDEA